MSYRNGTYIAFHAEGNPNPAESDMKYYNSLRMWKAREESDFRFINSHEKRNVRDTSSKEALRRALLVRLNNSKHLVLIIGKTTKNDTDWVPLEICHAIDVCKIPIIAAYTNYEWIMKPSALEHLWPKALADRINSGKARVIHVPFKKEPILAAIKNFDFNTPPSGALTHYTKNTYIKWGYSVS